MHKGRRILAPCTKPSRNGSVLANDRWVTFDLSWGGMGSDGYTWFEGLGGGGRAAREGGWIWAPRKKQSRQGSVSANEKRGVARMHLGGCPDVAERGIEVVGGRDRAARKGVG